MKTDVILHYTSNKKTVSAIEYLADITGDLFNMK